MNFITKFIREEDGVTAIEYGLIAALIAIVIIAALTAGGQSLDALWDKICGALFTAVGSAGIACV